jgi:hypothetical protein
MKTIKDSDIVENFNEKIDDSDDDTKRKNNKKKKFDIKINYL